MVISYISNRKQIQTPCKCGWKERVNARNGCQMEHWKNQLLRRKVEGEEYVVRASQIKTHTHISNLDVIQKERIEVR